MNAPLPATAHVAWGASGLPLDAAVVVELDVVADLQDRFVS